MCTEETVTLTTLTGNFRESLYFNFPAKGMAETISQRGFSVELSPLIARAVVSPCTSFMLAQLRDAKFLDESRRKGAVISHCHVGRRGTG